MDKSRRERTRNSKRLNEARFLCSVRDCILEFFRFWLALIVSDWTIAAIRVKLNCRGLVSAFSGSRSDPNDLLLGTG